MEDRNRIEGKRFKGPVHLPSDSIYNFEYVYGLREAEFIRMSEVNPFIYVLGSTICTAGVSQLIDSFAESTKTNGFSMSLSFFTSSSNLIWSMLSLTGLVVIFFAGKLSLEKRRINKDIREHFKRNRTKRLAGDIE